MRTTTSPPRIVRIDPQTPDPLLIAEAATILASGGLVAFPTETVYGLGARGLHKDEVARIFVAKGRPAGHPVILHVDGEAMARSVAESFSTHASRLASELWPGPLTLVVPRRKEIVPSEVSGGLDTVGVRAPAHPVALALIRAVGEPLAAPSANAHTHVSPTTAEHVVRSLGDRVDLILDAGPCRHGIESTVLTLATDPPRVLRLGAISLERLRAIDPAIVYESSVAAVDDSDEPRASPGMAPKHYAPHARVVLAERGAVESTLLSLEQHEQTHQHAKIAVIVATREGRASASAALNAKTVAKVIELPDDPEGYAHALYAALFNVDAAAAGVVVIERVPSDPAWLAVADRLERAAK